MNDVAYNFEGPWIDWNEWINWIIAHENDWTPQILASNTIHTPNQVPVSTTSTLSTPLISELQFHGSTMAEFPAAFETVYPQQPTSTGLVLPDSSILPSTLPSSELFSSSPATPAPTRTPIPEFDCKCPNCKNELNGLPPIVKPDREGCKQHICDVPGCKRRYRNPKSLRTHSRWHTGKGAHLCLTCGKGFKRNSELDRHLNTHIIDYPYSCSVCSKNFTCLDTFTRHKAKFCNDTFKSKEAISFQIFDQKAAFTQSLEECKKLDAQRDDFDYTMLR